jgi:23S rRNA (adenine2503-C2)-methyltransferase
LTDFQVRSVSGDPAVAEVAVLRFRGDDRFLVEAVDGLTPPLPRVAKWIVNLSTQAGCPVGCPYCDAGTRFHGNLSCQELLAQVRWALARHPGEAAVCAKLKVHFARMGEPALNDAVPEAMRALPELTGAPGLWCCVATTAPRGREAWFERVLELKQRLYRGRFQLQFSLQSTDQVVRRTLLPVPHWSFDEIAGFGRRFLEPGDRKVVLNFALAHDVPFDARVLERHFQPGVFAVKLTPVNPTARGRANGFRTRLRGGDEHGLREAVKRLRGLGYDVILSVGDAAEDRIGSNCGQAVTALGVS